jgi:hypothetical protein
MLKYLALLLCFAVSFPAVAYEIWVATLTSTSGTTACQAAPQGNANQRLALQCKGACHYRAAHGASTATQHDTLLSDGALFDLPMDGSVDTVCIVGDGNATVTAELFQVKP